MADWWRNAVIYQIYPRSFADSNGDGVGDIPGIISRLDHLAWLGVDALWCTPLTVSPNRDFGYDVADYTAIDPSFGTMDDFDRLVAEAGRRGIRVMLDLVPNHTSREHPWFRDERTKYAYYVWADRPNNWISSLHVPAWTLDPEAGRYYLHNYLPDQPDLDWWNEDVRAEFDRILRFWYDRGVAGFRIDAAYVIVKDRLLRDNPPATREDHLWDRNRGQRPVHSAHQPEVHEVLRRWRGIGDAYDPPRLLMGATWVPDPAELAAYYGAGDELHLPQYYQLLFCDFSAQELRAAVETWLGTLKPENDPVWLASNHDLSRFPTRWCDGDERKVRMALTMLLTLPGACVLFQGDELGLEDTVVPPDRTRDTAPLPRDASRTPLPWTPEPGGGFTTGEPWLPLGDTSRNVADQLADPGSVLHLTRRLIALKKRLTGPYEALPAPEGHWRYRRGGVTVDLDFRQWEVTVDE
ncbi:alpha-amylase family glycosyl hydrolase [Streptomyces capparidis]